MFRLVVITLITSVFLVPFYFFRFDLLGMPTNVFEVAVFVAFLAAIVDLVAKKRRIDWGGLWPYLFLVSVLVGVVISEDKTRAAGIAKGWFIVPAVFYWLIINYFNTRSIQRAIMALFGAMTFVSLWAILQRLGVVGLLFYQRGDSSLLQYLGDSPRSFGPFESPNYLAMYLVPTIILSLSLFGVARSTFKKMILLVALAMSVAAVIFSGSRGGLIAISFVLLVAACLAVKRYCGKKAFYLSAVGLPVVVIAAAYKMISTQDQVRLEIYRYAVDMVRDHPLLGIGLGDFRDEIALRAANNPTFIDHGLPYALHPHNLYLAIWLNLGIVGLLVFGLLLWGFLKKVRADKGGTGLFALLAMFAILAHGLVDTTYFKNDLAAIFWLVYAIPYLSDENDENRY